MMTRKIHKAIIASLLIGLPFTSFAKRYDVTLPEVASCLKTAQPGDQIYIKDGQYKDMQLKWTGKGTEKGAVSKLRLVLISLSDIVTSQTVVTKSVEA